MIIDGSWMPSWIPKQEFSNIGFIPMFPGPNGVNETSTMMGGWEFSIPKTSTHKDLAWELIKIILEPDVLSPWIATQGFIPTQISMGEGPGASTEQLRKSIPFLVDGFNDSSKAKLGLALQSMQPSLNIYDKR